MAKVGVGKMGSSKTEHKNKLSELLEWVAQTKGNVKSGCSICRHPQAAPAIKEILQAMAKLGKSNISQAQIFAKVKAETDLAVTSLVTMQRHLTGCEAVLWKQAKGK